jgi:hypothetical protein
MTSTMSGGGAASTRGALGRRSWLDSESPSERSPATVVSRIGFARQRPPAMARGRGGWRGVVVAG